MEKDKWDTKKLDKAMKESGKEVEQLNLDLFSLVVKFGVRALKTYQAARSESLNPLQINQIVTREIEHVINFLEDPHLADSIIRKAELDFLDLNQST